MNFKTLFLTVLICVNSFFTLIAQTDLDNIYSLESYIEKNDIDDSKLQIINYDCAILVYPTDGQIKKMKKEYGEEDFYVIADDNNYYQGTAIELLDSLKIKTITAQKNYIKLNGSKKKWIINVRKEGMPTWNLIFFKNDKEPQIISTPEISSENICKYFNCK